MMICNFVDWQRWPSAESVKAKQWRQLLDSYSSEMDPFLRHAIIYGLYEIGDVRSLPTGHPVGKQVWQMLEIDQQNVEQEMANHGSFLKSNSRKSRRPIPTSSPTKSNVSMSLQRFCQKATQDSARNCSTTEKNLNASSVISRARRAFGWGRI